MKNLRYELEQLTSHAIAKRSDGYDALAKDFFNQIYNTLKNSAENGYNWCDIGMDNIPDHLIERIRNLLKKEGLDLKYTYREDSLSKNPEDITEIRVS